MSETTTFDDLDMLRRDDLKAVLDSLSEQEVIASLWGTPISFRTRLLDKLTKCDAAKIEQAIISIDHQTFDQVYRAQMKAVSMMCQMSRAGLIAFDVPEDMVA